MAPLVPHWQRPSHPEIQEVIINDAAFTSKSLSKVAVPPFGLFAKLDFPPCTPADRPTYATVQMGRDAHLNLNSDLVYINHSCEPSLIFDMPTLSVLAGPKGLQPGDELTFFYPSTEWSMAQGFDCFCGTKSCRGRIDGAGNMRPELLEGLWLNGYIREMLAEKAQKTEALTNGTNGGEDAVEHALRTLMEQAKASVKLAEESLASYNKTKGGQTNGQRDDVGNGQSSKIDAAVSNSATLPASVGAGRTGPTSRELSGEMGGDTKST